jgi:hypothetical protein
MAPGYRTHTSQQLALKNILSSYLAISNSIHGLQVR